MSYMAHTRPDKSKRPTGTAAHYAIVERFDALEVGEAAQEYGVTAAEMARRIGITRSTLHRKITGKGRLTEHESDALARQRALLEQATDVLDGDADAARRWLATPQVGLGGAVPTDLARTTFGFREVEKLLVRLDYGVYA